MPSTRQILRARKRFATLLDDRATIQRPVNASDGGGGFTQTWPTLASNVPCRLSPVGGGEDDRSRSAGGDRVHDEAVAVITFAAGQDITEADRVVIASQTFDVLLVRRRGVYEITRRVEARELGPT